ncbi:unnamed protein product, partial [Meganyctiphanes norvegica]
QRLDEVPELLSVSEKSCEYLRAGHLFFTGICHHCCLPENNTHMRFLHRCNNCQLVAYCSKDCQKRDWKTHKLYCKLFPINECKPKLKIVWGTRVSFPKNWESVLEEIQKRAVLLIVVKTQTETQLGVYSKDRQCITCGKSKTEDLYDCVCLLVSFCSEMHRIAAARHLIRCDGLRLPQVYSVLRNFESIDHSTSPTEWVKDFLPIVKDDVSKYAYTLESLQIPQTEDYWVEDVCLIRWERLSYPFTLLYALQEIGVGREEKSVGCVTSLNIHIVSPLPMLDCKMWEFFMHHLPKLEELHLSFIGPTMSLHNQYNNQIELQRCDDCFDRNRLITLSINPMHYHMYFSSDAYTEPDVVIVHAYDEAHFAMKNALLVQEGDVHAITSYRNMTYSQDTLVVLTNCIKQDLEDGIKDINKARSIDVVMPIRENPLCGISTIRNNSSLALSNINAYITCLRKKL